MMINSPDIIFLLKLRSDYIWSTIKSEEWRCDRCIIQKKDKQLYDTPFHA